MKWRNGLFVAWTENQHFCRKIQSEFCEWSKQGLLPGVFPLKYLQRGKQREREEVVKLYRQMHRYSEQGSYLLIDLHGLLGVVEEELLPGGSQVHVYLQARVLRELPAVWPTAEGTVKCFCDRHIQQGALSFFCPHTAEKEREWSQSGRHWAGGWGCRGLSLVYWTAWDSPKSVIHRSV